MNVKQVVTALSILAAASGAMAAEATQWKPSAGPVTRSEVKAELARAIASGEMDAQRGEAYGSFDRRNQPISTRSRAEVKAELAQAVASGEIEAQRGEAYGSFDRRTPATTTLTRAEVKQDLARARASGELALNRGETYGSFPEVVPSDGSRPYFAWRKPHGDANVH